MANHDASYKGLYSHPRMVEDFLRGFVLEPWVADLDFSTLEKVNSQFISEEGKSRDGDVVWRVRCRGHWLYVYLLFEFQSTVDPWMGLRLMVYIGLLYQDLIRHGVVKKGEKLPPVLPVVLYNGKGPWSAVEDVWELIEPAPDGLDRYQPRLRYFLLDEGRLAESELGSLQNLSAALFRLERSWGQDEIERVVEAMAGALRDPALQSLEETFSRWIRQVLLPARAPGVEIPEVRSLKEVRTMLAERVVEWTQEWKEEGLQEGLQKGWHSLFEVVLGLLEWRLGPVDEGTRQKLEQRTLEELADLAKRIPTASSLDSLGLG